MFEISIRTAGAAFADPYGDGEPAPGLEIARILREIAEDVEHGQTGTGVMDSNGNRVGSWSLTDD